MPPYNLRPPKEEDLPVIVAFEIEIARISFPDDPVVDPEVHRKKLAKALERDRELCRAAPGRALAPFPLAPLGRLRRAFADVAQAGWWSTNARNDASSMSHTDAQLPPRAGTPMRS